MKKEYSKKRKQPRRLQQSAELRKRSEFKQLKLVAQSPRETRTVQGGIPLWKFAKNPCLRSGLHMCKEDESYQRTAKELRMQQTTRRQTVLRGNGTPRSSGPVRAVKPHGLLLQYLINTPGIYLRSPKGRALRIKTTSKTKDYSRPSLTKPKIGSDQNGGRG